MLSYYSRMCVGGVVALVCLVGQKTLFAQQPDDLVPIQFPGTPIEVLIQQYKRITGKQIIEGQNLSGPTITLHTPERVPREEAIRLMEAAMLLNGFAVVPAGENTVKILNISSQNPRAEGLPIYTDLSQLPFGDQVVSFFTSLTHIPVQEAVNTLAASIPQTPYTSILPIENNQSVVITEKTPVIRQLVQLVRLIDTPQASLKREFIQLTRADAEIVAEQLQNLIQSSSNNNAGNARNNRGNNTPPDPNPAETAADAISTLTAETVQIVPDPRTNRILIVAPKSSFEYLKQLVLDFDSAVDFSKPLTRPLRYVKAGEILPVLGEFLAEGEEEVEITDAESESNTSNNTGGGGGSSLSRPDQLSDSDLSSAPQSLTVGKTRIIADRRNNSILIMGPPENINRASAILDSLDIPAQQIFLSAVIGQITLDDTTEFGVDILQKFERTGDFGGAAQNLTQGVTGGTLLDPRTLVTTGAFPAGSAGTVLYGTFTDSLDVFVRALKTTNNFKVLSRPTVFTTNNKKAVLLSGRREPIPTQSLSTLNNTTDINSSVTTNVDFEDVVLKLEVIPLINSDDQVTLTIAQQNDSLSGNRVIGGNSVPIINTQELLTNVTVKNRNTVILGGLIEDSAQDETTGLPILSDIPLLGSLFKNTTRSRPRTELVIMVQPEIVKRIEDVTPTSDRRIGETFVGKDAVDFSDSGGAQRIRLDSMWRLKHGQPEAPDPAKTAPERQQVIPSATPVDTETDAPPQDISPQDANLEAYNQAQPSAQQKLPEENASLLVEPEGIERPQTPGS